jgi:hypothetical protein
LTAAPLREYCGCIDPRRPTHVALAGFFFGSARQARSQKYAFAFLDETGTLGGARDPYFAVGLLSCSDPYYLARPVQRIRDRQHFYDEIKWNKVSEKKLPLMKDLVNVFFSSNATFSAFVADKTRHDVIGRFGGPFKAYEALARQLRLSRPRWILGRPSAD